MRPSAVPLVFKKKKQKDETGRLCGLPGQVRGRDSLLNSIFFPVLPYQKIDISPLTADDLGQETQVTCCFLFWFDFESLYSPLIDILPPKDAV